MLGMTAADIMVALLFAGIFGAVYSYWMGTSKLAESISGVSGGIFGILADVYMEFGVILQSGISNFLQPGYIGVSVLVIGVGIFLLVIFINILSTLDKNPTAIQ